MSLRTRLVLTLGVTLMLLWGLAAAWLMRDLYQQVETTLDQRLAQSARMVAGLMAQLPVDVWEQADHRALSIPPIEGLACQVHSPRGEIIARTHTDMDGILKAREPGHAYREEGGMTWRVFTYERDGLTITTADRMDERDLLMRNVLEVAVVPFVVALAGSLLALWAGVVRGLRPLDRLREALARRDPEALAPVVTHGVPSEIRPLVETLNQLLARIQQAIVREQHFTNDAAHELRTPLTAIKTHLQVAGRVEGEASRQALAQAEEGVARLSRTLDQLLMLARVEGRLHFEEGEASRADDVVELALRDASASDRARFTLPPAWPEARLAVPRELAITALRNLLDNALHHGSGEGPVEVSSRLDEAGEALTYRVRDHGPGVDDDQLEQLPRRFWRASRRQGSGLGLAIVAAIAERVGGRLAFSRPEGGGLEARLTLPLKQGLRPSESGAGTTGPGRKPARDQ
ncbi:two-component sensor histidine kinase [Halomonas aestuarii]|uniref:histidine kinase n=1 Tax=Halomonas aestuarii TaxID=1897729 RepID=A0A1J0VDM7_9GAMM|nr:ATP-binding protein [Halomonas aestuarii]APE30117.1 two-component sensor histidine kinase [Halomonas aestuarii]